MMGCNHVLDLDHRVVVLGILEMDIIHVHVHVHIHIIMVVVVGGSSSSSSW